jgi:hypothetical protein
MPPDWNRQRQVSGLWYDANKFPGLAADQTDFLMQQTPPGLSSFGDLLWTKAEAPTWWTVNLWGVELVRFLTVGSPAQQPLSQSALLANGQRFTRLKARVQWENMQLLREVDVDIGTGTRFPILANNLRIMLLIPQSQRFQEMGTVVNTVATNNTMLTNGLLIDSMVGASAYPCFAPLSNRYPTFTQLIAQLAFGEVGVVAPIEVPVPPAAKYLSIYPSGDPALIPWVWFTTPIAAGGAAVGTIFYDPTISAVVRRPIPQNVSTIVMPVATPFRRRWNLIWELEL